ncbi:cytochrome P450 18a1 [Parasteatoda tepidariorum]|uniref:cytochrome P450 18a1 n=1 Tax=Parasteatoda tepidariorum TaxID=114398 RepID=UPI001C726A2F|nr:cytochrome P450 18a1 [Parasteatoda tepidariorum]
MRNTHTIAMLPILSFLSLFLDPCIFLSTGVFFLVRRLVLRYLKTHRLSYEPPKGPSGKMHHRMIYGYLNEIGKYGHMQFAELAKQYGPIYEIRLGQKRVVVLNEYNLIRQAFRLEAFSGRPDTALTELLKGRGIINSTGPLWEEQRNFLHSMLRNFGAKNSGKNRIPMERNIQNQVDEFLSEMYETRGAPIRIRPKLTRGVSNVVGLMLMNKTFETATEDFQRMVLLIEEGFTLLTTAIPVNYISFLRYIPFWNHGYIKMKQNKAETEAYFAKIVEEHKRTFDPNNIRDFIDAFLLEKQKAENEQKENFFTEKQLLQVLGDIYSAGLETVTSTLEWTIVFLLRHPEVQERVHEEIDDIIGQDRKPDLSDMSHLPYTEAMLLEVQRIATVIPLGNPHACIQNAKLGGYLIEKGTHVMSNLWAVHMDPNLWDKPDEFNPERFLVNDRVVKPPYFMPFSVGRRMCVGDTLARMEIFLFMVSLLQKFKLCVPEGHDPPSRDGNCGISFTANPFTVCVIPRN